MKRLLALLTAILLCVGVLAACGENTPAQQPDGNSTDAATEAPAAETFDAGNVTVAVPAGWKAFPSKDLFAEDKDAMDPDVVTVCKGGQTDLDLFTKPNIRVNYYAPTTTMYISKEFYDDVVDLEDMTIGSYTWHGFSCDSLGYKYYILYTGEDDEVQFQASILYGGTDESIRLEDADVQAILASIKPSK